jgi:ATP-binding cassette subfamily B (MDR/TAP) protein 1
MQRRYSAALEAPLRSGVRQAWLAGFAFGGMQIIIYSSFGIALIYGAFRVIAGAYTGGDVMSVLISVLMGGFAIAQVRVRHVRQARRVTLADMTWWLRTAHS